MIKLSEIGNDENIIVRWFDDDIGELTDKQQLLHDMSHMDIVPTVYTCGDPYHIEFKKIDIYHWLEHYEDDMYEDWVDDLYGDIINLPETKAFLEALNNCSKSRCSYWEKDKIEIDITPERKDDFDFYD